MKTLIRQSIRTGFTFGIVQVFFILIAFNSMIGIMLAKISGIKNPGEIPAPKFLIAYTILMGLWVGISALSKKKSLSVGQKLLAGISASLASAILVGLLEVAMTAILVNKIFIREYLTVLSFDFIKATLFGLTPTVGILVTIGCILVGSLVGVGLNILANLHAVQEHWKKDLGFIKSLIEKFQHIVRGKYHLIWQIIGISLLAVAVILIPMKWGSYWNYVFGTVGLYVILGLGLNIVVGLSGQLVLGYIAFFAIGAYTMALLNAPEPHNLMWGFWPALLLGVVLAALSGLLLGLPIMRLRGDYLAIVTLGFGEIIRILLKSDVLTDFTGGPRGIQNIHGPMLFGRPFNSEVDFVYLIIAGVILASFVYNRLQQSRTGRAWLAIREDETVARASGVDTIKYKLLALAIGAAFAGLAGGIYASRNQFTGPDEHALMASINVLSLIIVGGMGNIPGTILGAFTLKGLPEILREFANFRLLAFGALLVFMMLSRPEGLIPSHRPKYTEPKETSLDSQKKEVPHDK
ncbi:MAG TPA: branched-chain amino acid ABC transporter permease [Anaerolineaceae bacterium]|nr:branched-chain amino acid ABC transporter permease [Anaerolineaceae bacterium]